MCNLKTNMFLNFLITFSVGNKYYGALHLGGYTTNDWLQIFCGSAAFKCRMFSANILRFHLTKGSGVVN
jgi:hypothetical protein